MTVHPKKIARQVLKELVADFITLEHEGRRDNFSTRLDAYSDSEGDAIMSEMKKILRKA